MEKELIRSTPFNVKKIFNRIIIGVLILGFAIYTYQIATWEWIIEEFGSFVAAWFGLLFTLSKYGSLFYGYTIPYWSIVPAIGLSLVLLIIRAWLGSMEVIVTDKRVYGTAKFGRRVDLPLDSISAVATSAAYGIAVSTSSGVISFLMIKNAKEIHMCINNLLVKRQSIQPVAPTIKQEIHQSSADELKKYKELLDSGVISQEEFDAKKKQLLGL